MVQLGVGKNMVRAIRHWSLVCGVLEERRSATATAGRRLALQPTLLGRALFEDGGTNVVDDSVEPTARFQIRGTRLEVELPDGTALLIDESYNANPASMAASLALLGQTQIGPRGRRIAVLGDMLELGPRGRALHRGLVEPAQFVDEPVGLGL